MFVLGSAGLLTGGDHMAAHVQCSVMLAGFGCPTLLVGVVGCVSHLFGSIYRGRGHFTRLLHARAVQALVQDLALVREVP